MNFLLFLAFNNGIQLSAITEAFMYRFTENLSVRIGVPSIMFVFYFKSDFVPSFCKFFWDFQDDFFKFYSDESDGLSLEDTDDASESETYHNRLASQSINANCNQQSKQMKEQLKL
jgi:hypothetical protein